MDLYYNFKEKIMTKQAKIGVVGLGYVGLPFAIAAIEKDFFVYGFEIDKKKVSQLLDKKSYLKDLDSKVIANAFATNRFYPTSNFDYLKDVDIIVICVPTPLNKKRKPDLTCIYQACKEIDNYLSSKKLIILESTTYPGTTDELAQHWVKKSGLTLGEDFFVAFSPERIDPANEYFNVKNTAKLVGGVEEKSTLLATLFYQSILDSSIIPVKNAKTAEMSKILENTYRLVNIALIFEFIDACEKLEINIWDVIEGANSKPYGFQAFYPGPGVGGHCIPIDPVYLTWKMKKKGLSMPLITKANKIIQHTPSNILNKMKKILKEHGKKMKNSKVLLIGITYKKDTNDLRESPTLKILEKLKKKKIQTDFYDPYATSIIVQKKRYESIDLSQIDQYDLVVICVDHSIMNYDLIYEKAKLVLDLKNTVKLIKERREEEKIYGF